MLRGCEIAIGKFILHSPRGLPVFALKSALLILEVYSTLPETEKLRVPSEDLQICQDPLFQLVERFPDILYPNMFPHFSRMYFSSEMF